MKLKIFGYWALGAAVLATIVYALTKDTKVDEIFLIIPYILAFTFLVKGYKKDK